MNKQQNTNLGRGPSWQVWLVISFVFVLVVGLLFIGGKNIGFGADQAQASQSEQYSHLFRQKLLPAQASKHAFSAAVGDADKELLASDPRRLIIDLPDGSEFFAVEEQYQTRDAQSLVWRGMAQNNPSYKVTLTMSHGFLFGNVENGKDVYAIYPSADGRSIIEKINFSSFDPEWGHDQKTRGKEMVPPASTSDGTVTAAADATIYIIDLMSVYTPQARVAGGGTELIQAAIQAAVDRTNSAFINSNMIVSFNLVHTEEVAYNDSGDIITDLSWVRSNAYVADLRNTYGADMVSLITVDGGGYCGVGYVDRNPGPGFAPYAFQVTAVGCLPNQTLAHEHGHNLGMEHNPENSDATPSQASYPWSFGHYVDGSFRTIMSYACPSSCPRVLNYSNPSINYAGQPTGIVDKRDNAQTGNLTAPITAEFRPTMIISVNNSPTFTTNPVVGPSANQGMFYSATLAGTAIDPDNDPLTFWKMGGPTWLIVGSNGAMSGTPGAGNIGLNSFDITVSDGKGGSTSATLQINVNVSNDTTPPVVTITSPADGSVLPKSKITISASASDLSGIASIAIAIDGGVIKTCLNVASCSYSWSAGKVVSGSHIITVSAADKAPTANTAIASVTVTK